MDSDQPTQNEKSWQKYGTEQTPKNTQQKANFVVKLPAF